MHPSEMTDDELRLAIAKVVAKEKGWLVSKGDYSFRHDEMGQTFVAYIPNYPGDIAAAMGLLDEYDNVLIDKTYSKTDGFSTWEVTILPKSSGRYTGDNKFLPRAISEAVYAAMKEHQCLK